MKSALVYTAEGVVSTKAQRQRDLMSRHHAQTHAPPSYTHNSIKEELCLEYIQSFLEQFSRAYRNRATPFLVAENEFGVRKCVCTTLRPTLVGIPELYDVYECASFLAGYTLYEPLENPQEPPKSLFSPQQVLESHTGDAFDLANLLCSFLLGAGYDAYVVYGVAPLFITRKDQSLTPCPLIADAGESSARVSKSSQTSHNAHTHAHAHDEESEVSPSAAGNATDDLSPSHYVAPDTTVRDSAFLSSLAEKQRLRNIDTFSLWIPDPPLESITSGNSNSNNSIADGGVHAWVLLRAGRREIKEDTLVEPSTGRLYSAKNSPYIAVDAVWNHVSYFVNAKRETKVSDIQFQFEEGSGWEPLFLSRATSKATETNNDGGEDHDLMHNDGGGSGEQKTSSSSFAGGNGIGADDDRLRYFDAPPAWSAPLSLPRHKYLVRYPPNGLRTVQYYCAKADFFAKGTNEQCMVMRITLYLNQACTIVKEIHEWFENRVDRMYKRIRYFLDDRRFVEYFNPGSRGEIKRWTERPGRSIDVDFFVDGRLDRLARREEIIGQSVTETFRGRTDLLVFRSVTLTADKGDALSGTRQFTLPATHLGPELYITRMVQEFERNPVSSSSSALSLSATMTMSTGNKAGNSSKSGGAGEGEEEEMEIAKRDFFVREGKVVLYYHFAPNQVTGRVRTLMHTKGPTVPVPTDLAISQEVGLEEDPEACQEAAAFERECFTAIKTSYQAHDKLTEARLAGEMRVSGEKTVFERALDSVEFLTAKTTNALDSSSATESKGIDFLAPFLRNVADPNQLTREEALGIRQACLDALKARLVERANIIQTKLHEENAKLGRKQELFQRSQREGDFSTEEYEKYCTEAMFRIQILEQRLAAHEEAALRKFSDLDLKLSNDPRLRVLKS